MKACYILILNFICLNCFAQNNFIVEAKNLVQFNNAKVYFYIEDNDPRVYSEKPDSVVIKNGEFKFSGVINQPSQKAKIIIKAKEVFTSIMVIDTGFNDVQLQEVETINFPKYYIANVINSKASRLKQQIDSIHNKYVNAYRKEVNKPSGSISLPIRIQQKYFKEQISIIKVNPHDFYSLIVLNEISKYASMLDQQELILNAFNNLNDNLKDSSLGRDLYRIVSESLNAKNSTKAGQVVPVFKVETIENQLFNNSSLNGNPYLIAFSATWCLPCLEMQPKLLELYNKYKSQGFKVVYFNIDDNVNKWKEHVIKRNLTWINVSEQTKPLESKICKQFNVVALPTYFLVNSAGIIDYNSDEANDNYKNLESKVKKLLISKN